MFHLFQSIFALYAEPKMITIAHTLPVYGEIVSVVGTLNVIFIFSTVIRLYQLEFYGVGGDIETFTP